jgi:hypothetical protein
MCPGRTAARSAAAQTRDRLKLQASNGPASAVHRCALHRVRDTLYHPSMIPSASSAPVRRLSGPLLLWDRARRAELHQGLPQEAPESAAQPP